MGRRRRRRGALCDESGKPRALAAYGEGGEGVARGGLVAGDTSGGRGGATGRTVSTRAEEERGEAGEHKRWYCKEKGYTGITQQTDPDVVDEHIGSLYAGYMRTKGDLRHRTAVHRTPRLRVSPVRQRGRSYRIPPRIRRAQASIQDATPGHVGYGGMSGSH